MSEMNRQVEFEEFLAIMKASNLQEMEDPEWLEENLNEEDDNKDDPVED
jgi:hypothetical protein